MHMKPRDRVLAALEHRSFDRLPIKHLAVSEIDRMLYRYFGVGEENALLDVLGHDFREIRPRYCGPPMDRLDSEHGIISGVVMARAMQEQRPGVALPLADIIDIAQLDQFSYPIYDWYDYGSVAEQCRQYDDYALQLGYCEGDFINGLSGLRGQEQVLIDIASSEPVLVELVERRFRVVFEHLRRGLESGGGRIDILHIGDDFGSQKGLLISPGAFERLFAQRYEALCALAHRHGARTMMHICGSVFALIPRLIEIGLDILDVVQTNAAGMDLPALKEKFGDRLAFAGTMCVQEVLPFASAERVRAEVQKRLDLFGEGGLIIGPSHQIQPDTPLANILEMYRAAGGLRQ